MDNYFQKCAPMMDDGRGFTDFRSSQVREELFKYKNNVSSENESRTLRIDRADDIMDLEWNSLGNARACFPKKKCFHINPITQVTSAYNNAEILAYNGELPAPTCNANLDTHDYRMSVTKGSRVNPQTKKSGYPPEILHITRERLYDVNQQ